MVAIVVTSDSTRHHFMLIPWNFIKLSWARTAYVLHHILLTKLERDSPIRTHEKDNMLHYGQHPVISTCLQNGNLLAQWDFQFLFFSPHAHTPQICSTRSTNPLEHLLGVHGGGGKGAAPLHKWSFFHAALGLICIIATWNDNIISHHWVVTYLSRIRLHE